MTFCLLLFMLCPAIQAADSGDMESRNEELETPSTPPQIEQKLLLPTLPKKGYRRSLNRGKLEKILPIIQAADSGDMGSKDEGLETPSTPPQIGQNLSLPRLPIKEYRKSLNRGELGKTLPISKKQSAVAYDSSDEDWEDEMRWQRILKKREREVNRLEQLASKRSKLEESAKRSMSSDSNK